MSYYTIENLQDNILTAETSSETHQHLFSAIQRLTQIYQAWQDATASGEMSSQDWLTELKDEHGAPLFSPEEVPVYAPVLNRIFTHLNEIISHKSLQRGGKFPQGLPVRGPDDIVQTIMERMEAVNQMSRSYAREYGLLKMLNDADQGKRQNFKTPVIPEIGLVTPIPISPRLVIVFAYSLVEIARVLVSGAVPALRSDLLRRVLSLILGTTDLLFGRWKQAILSYSGFFGSNILYSSLILKMALDTFYLLSPEIRKEVIFTTVDSFKSLIIGLIITSFQTIAPAPVRAQVEASLKIFNDSIGNINAQLTAAGLAPLPPELHFSFGNLNNLQVLVRKPEIICSKEMEDVVKIFSKDAPSLNFALQLLGYPTDSGRRREICRRSGYELGDSTLMELFVANSKRETTGAAAATAASTATVTSNSPSVESVTELLSTPPDALPASAAVPLETQPQSLPPQDRVQTPDIPEGIPKNIRSVPPRPAVFGKLNSLRGKMPQLSAAAESPKIPSLSRESSLLPR